MFCILRDLKNLRHFIGRASKGYLHHTKIWLNLDVSCLTATDVKCHAKQRLLCILISTY